MKKLITILAILTVLVGALFASTDTHQIKLTVTIDDTAPTFRLRTTSGVTAEASALAGETAEAVLSAANKAALTANTGTVSVGFAIEQVSNSRTLSGYTMSVAASNLILIDTNDSPKSVDRRNLAATNWDSAVTAATDIESERFTVVAGAPVLTQGSTNHISYEGSGTSSLSVQYDGVAITASAQTAVSIGTFTVAYNANPNAKPGNYEAHVTLTVTAD